MAVYIPQNPEEVKRSFGVQRRAEIVEVRLCRGSMDSHPTLREFHDLAVHVGHESKAELAEDGLLSTNIDFALTTSPRDNDSLTVFSVKCSFQATYRLEDGYQPTPEETEAFATANAVFNVWPYFREFVQNAGIRMGLSATPVVPFLKLVPKPEENPTDPASE